MPDTLVHSDWLLRRAAALPPAFVCSMTNRGPDVAWVHVAGELDIATAPRLEQTLRDAQGPARLVVLDLRELALIDSSGVHVVVSAGIRARQAGHRLVLLCGPSDVERVLRLTGQSDEVEIGDAGSIEPPVGALLRLAGQGRVP
jgi:anti-sigma B factor antagonist